MSERIYLDNAATSWPKPEAVYAAVDRYQRLLGAPPGRSSYSEAAETNRLVESARRSLARLLGIGNPSHLIFTCNGTDGLNLAIHGLLRPGDRVITSVMEHNSVLRPLRRWQLEGNVEVVRIACDKDGTIDLDELAVQLRGGARLAALSHASNVTGAIQPMEEIAQLCQRYQVLLLVDAAQSVGHLPLALDSLGVDLLAASGHKGLLGPLGTGLLYIKPGVETLLSSTRQGGTGTHSEQDQHPEQLPGKYEAGSLNVPGIVGLGAAADWLLEQGVANLHARSLALTEELLAGLSAIPGVVVHGSPNARQNVGLVSFSIEGYDPQEVAATLDSVFRIQTRSGLHCAPGMHQSLGTLARGGTVRFSLGAFSSSEHVDRALQAIERIAAAAVNL